MPLPRALACLLAVTAACTSAAGLDEPPPTLSRMEPEAVGARCVAGGQALRQGRDLDGDGVLADAEVEGTEYLCAAAQQRALLRRDAEAPGRRCQYGGLALRLGIDDDGDGFLADAEIDQTDYVCNLAPVRALARRADEPAGARCPIGGIAVHTGLDDDGSGTLEDDEIDHSEVVCHEVTSTAFLRSADEPAGARCPHGGVIVHTGLDRDGNGALDDAEITASASVCSTPPAVVLVRSDVAGAACPYGGTDVCVGIDDDGDGVLDDSEIDQTRPVCDAPPIGALVRSDAEPAGPHCAAGGTAVRAGVDDDSDGVLDEAEVDATAYICTPDIITGDLVIDGATTAEQLTSYAGVRVITGALSIQDGAAVALPALELVGGSVVVSGAARDVALPNLATIGVDLRVRGPDLAALDLASLRRVGGHVSLRDAAALTASLPALTQVTGDVEIAAITGLEATSLAQIDGRLIANAPASLPRLASTAGLEIAAAYGTLTLPALTRIRGGLSVTSSTLEVLSLPALTEVDGRVAVTAAAALRRVDLSSLQTAAGVTVEDAPALAELPLGALTRLTGPLWLDLVPSLTAIDLGQLARIDDGAALYYSSLGINLTGLRELRAPTLQHLDGDIDIRRNPDLERVDLGELAQARRVFFTNNPKLASVVAAQMTHAEQLTVENTPALTTLDLRTVFWFDTTLDIVGTGLTNLTGLGQVSSVLRARIADNPGLTTIGLVRLGQVGRLEITGNAALTSLGSLTGLQTVGGNLRIIRSPALRSLTGLDELRTVNGTLELTDLGVNSLAGLGNLRMTAGHLWLEANSSLTSLNGVPRLRAVGTDVYAIRNPSLPTAEVRRLQVQVGTRSP